MPGSETAVQDVVSHLNETLVSLLGQSNGITLDQRLVAASKKILMQKIEFEPARRTSSLFPLHALRTKYTPLNASHADKSCENSHALSKPWFCFAQTCYINVMSESGVWLLTSECVTCSDVTVCC
jgi:hypothetical protein